MPGAAHGQARQSNQASQHRNHFLKYIEELVGIGLADPRGKEFCKATVSEYDFQTGDRFEATAFGWMSADGQKLAAINGIEYEIVSDIESASHDDVFAYEPASKDKGGSYLLRSPSKIFIAMMILAGNENELAKHGVSLNMFSAVRGVLDQNRAKLIELYQSGREVEALNRIDTMRRLTRSTFAKDLIEPIGDRPDLLSPLGLDHLRSELERRLNIKNQDPRTTLQSSENSDSRKLLSLVKKLEFIKTRPKFKGEEQCEIVEALLAEGQRIAPYLKELTQDKRTLSNVTDDFLYLPENLVLLSELADWVLQLLNTQAERQS